MHEIIDTDFVFPKGRQKPHKRMKTPGKYDTGYFIAWDGEGITYDNGQHNYILFGNSNGQYVENREGNNLTTAECFDLLLITQRAAPKAIHVIYFGSYDFNMMLRDLPVDALRRLNNGDKAYYLHYSIDVRFGKKLWVKDRRDGTTVTLWDVGSFFQQSFVKSLQTWKINTRYMDNIIEQKANRANFKLLQYEEIKVYCGQELDCLVTLMEVFLASLKECGIVLNAWHGPGAIANTLYKTHGIKGIRQPEEINIAAQYAYGGGRIEPIKQGTANDQSIYYYDIRSAYPAAISLLPALETGKWYHYDGTTDNPDPSYFGLYHIRWQFSSNNNFYPIRHRYTNGNVCYPQAGTGTWIWEPEYRILCDYFPGQFQCMEWYEYDDTGKRPFSWVNDIYQQRAAMKKEGRGAERILKLGLNSLYGKMIQQLGWERHGKPPTYHQLESGGYVTSYTRSQLYRAAATNSKSIIGFETDGILTTDQLQVRTGDTLGAWECDIFNGLVYVQSGFYWLQAGNTWRSKYRGFDPGSVTREGILAAWANEQPYVEAQLTRHMGLAYSLHTNNMQQWGNWITSPRQLNVGNTSDKRVITTPGPTTRDQCLWNTEPYGIGTEHSAPYPLEWKNELPDWKIRANMLDETLDDYGHYA